MMETNVVQEVVVLDQLVETVLLHIVQLLDQVEVEVHRLLLVLLLLGLVEEEVVLGMFQGLLEVLVEEVMVEHLTQLALQAQQILVEVEVEVVKVKMVEQEALEW
jgi:hypothetical protein